MRDLRVLDLPEVWKELIYVRSAWEKMVTGKSLKCLQFKGGITPRWLSQAFIRQGEAEHLGALLVSKPKELQGNNGISTASRNPTFTPLFSHNNYFCSFLHFKGGAQLGLNFLENISPNSHGLCSVPDRELFQCLRTVTFGPNLWKKQNHNSKNHSERQTKAIFSHLIRVIKVDGFCF